MPSTRLKTKSGDPVQDVRVQADLREVARCLAFNGYIEVRLPEALVRIEADNVAALVEE